MLGSANLIAVDAGEFSVKTLNGKWQNANHFSGQPGEYVIIDKADEISPIEASGFSIRQSLKVLKAKNPEIFTAIPLKETILREVNVEDEVDIEGALEIELNDSLPFSLDQVYFDFAKVSPKNNKYLVAASRRDIVDPLTYNIREVNKKISNINVDIDAFAYGRLISQVYSDILQSDRIVLLIDIGHRYSRFYFYDSNGLVYHREQQIGGLQATENVIEVYDLDDVEAQDVKHNRASDAEFHKLVTIPYTRAFAEQLNLVLDFYEAANKSDKNIDSIVLVGGGACLEGFATELDTQISYTVNILDLSSVWNRKSAGKQDWLPFCANYALCIALLAEGVLL